MEGRRRVISENLWNKGTTRECTNKTLIRVQREGRTKDKEGKVRYIKFKGKEANEIKFIKEYDVRASSNLDHADISMDGKKTRPG